MRRLATVALLVVMAAWAAGVSGKWSGKFSPLDENSDEPLYLVLTQNGNELTGSGGPNESEQHPMQNGKIDGDHVTFEVPAGKGTFFFDLKMTGDEMKGDLQFKEASGNSRTAKVAVKRAA
jgi:hypothetical protein